MCNKYQFIFTMVYVLAVSLFAIYLEWKGYVIW